jgi:acetoin utilization deacetylase AcuC-like enzyme
VAILIIDIDLHYGDGTARIFRGDYAIRITNPGSVDINFEYQSMEARGYLKRIKAALRGGDYDLIGISAGFDTYVEDWGGLLETEHFEIVGRMIAQASQKAWEGALRSWKAITILTWL